MKTFETRLPLTLAGVLAISVGCATGPGPDMARREAARSVHVAEVIGADATPDAAHQLELARGELEHAERLIARGEMDWAGELLERAKADADLAIALRREDEAEAAALATHEELDQWHDQERGTDGATLPAGAITPAASVGTTTEE